MRKRYNAFIGENTLKSLKYLAVHTDTTVSEIIRQAIREFLSDVKAGKKHVLPEEPRKVSRADESAAGAKPVSNPS